MSIKDMKKTKARRDEERRQREQTEFKGRIKELRNFRSEWSPHLGSDVDRYISLRITELWDKHDDLDESANPGKL